MLLYQKYKEEVSMKQIISIIICGLFIAIVASAIQDHRTTDRFNLIIQERDREIRSFSLALDDQKLENLSLKREILGYQVQSRCTRLNKMHKSETKKGQ
jgi:uncharacterized protein YxeA